MVSTSSKIFPEIKFNKVCRICGSRDLKLYFDLGKTALANSFLARKDLNKKEKFYPLRVYFCRNCGLAQLRDVVSPEVMFRNYVYFSSGMPRLSKHFKDYADDTRRRFIKSKNDLVVELGSNDGLLLKEFQDYGVRVLGVDPAVNIARVANKRGVETLPEFFSLRLATKIKEKYGTARVIIGNNVVAHIDDHHDLLKGVTTLLDKEGVFIFEAPYLVDMFENLTFDTIYHEHLSYLAVRPIKYLLAQYGMEIIDVKVFPVQGNSIRVFAANKGKFPISLDVSRLLAKEKQMRLDRLETYLKLARKISKMKTRVHLLLKKLKKQGKSIAAYGAPAKGNTLLSYYDIGKDILDYATEELESKIGLFTPGKHIPVIDIKEARKNPPDFFLLLAWNYRDAIIEKERAYLANGGKLIVPVGEIGVVDNKSLLLRNKQRPDVVSSK